MENQSVFCNKCGREFKKINGILHEDGLFVKKDWGFFSDKDLQIHTFNLCEMCYDQMIQEFVIPISVESKETVLD